MVILILTEITHFNPRSREGSDLLRLFIVWVVDISIHAPAKGATREVLDVQISTLISIHAPAKGATTSPVILAA